jgi:glycosyltransferase involved in cell wall biosynthesis
MQPSQGSDRLVTEQAPALSGSQESTHTPSKRRAPKVIMGIHHASSLGGASISFLDVLAMLRVNYKILATCPNEPPALALSLKSDSHQYVATGIPIPLFNHCNGGSPILSRTFLRGMLDYLRFRKRWIECIKSYKPEFVIVNSSVMVLMGPIIRRAGVKSICIVRETFPPKWRSIRTRLLCLLLDKYFDGVLFLSEYDRSFAGLSRTATEVVRDCARPGTYSALARSEACTVLGVPEETFNLLYTGGASWLKGLDVALRSLSHLEYTDIRLLVAGDMTAVEDRTSPTVLLRCVLHPRHTSFIRSVKRLLEGQATADRVKIIGTQSDMARCYSASDVVIFPSNLPHQARPIFESGMYSLPVIVSDYVETREFMRHELNGLTFKPRSAKGLAGAVDRLYEDKPMGRALGEANRIRTLREHSFEVEQIRLLAFVANLLRV